MGRMRPHNRAMFVVGGSVKKAGGSLGLAYGQIALVNTKKQTAQGLEIQASMAGVSKREKVWEIRRGPNPKKTLSRSTSNKAWQTTTFALEDVVGVEVSAPKITEQKFDEVVIGWDGITTGSEFKFERGDRYFSLAVEASGSPVSYQGSQNNTEIAHVKIEIPQCDPNDSCETCDECATVDCRPIILEAIETLKRKQIQGGNTFGDLMEITPVIDCTSNPTLTLDSYTYYTLTLCDTGSDEALALVQAQYNTPVIRLNRVGPNSTYQVLLPDTAGVPTDYSQGIRSIIKGCDVCPPSYTASPEGYLYSVTIEDDGLASAGTTAFGTLPGLVAGTLIRQGGDAGVGSYTVIVSAELTQAQITTWLASSQVRGTGRFYLNGQVDALCVNAATTDTAWVAGDSCNATTEKYQIVLSDTECGASRLSELQLAYPDLSVVVAKNLSYLSMALTVSAAATANITIGTTNYLSTFATSAAVTAADFVTAHAAAILTAYGVTVTSAGNKLIFEDLTGADLPTITFTQVTGTYTAVLTNLDKVGGCSSVYEATVVTNMVCEECDPIFQDYYRSEAPDDYDFAKWQLVSATSASGCKCGIRFKGKPFLIDPNEPLRPAMEFEESSVEIRVSAMYPDDIREDLMGRLPDGVMVGRHLKYKQDRTHLAGRLRGIEEEGMAHFESRAKATDYLEKYLKGQFSCLEDSLEQWVQYTLKLNPKRVSGQAQSTDQNVDYSFWAPVGLHQDVEDFVNMIAANAGLEAVQAFGV
jgi:hypothetical protein